MTSTQNDPSTVEAAEVDTDDVRMKHPDLGDVVSVPWFAVEGHEQRGYVAVDDEGDVAPAETLAPSAPPALPAPTGATSTRATTSGLAKTPGPDGGQTATPTV